MSHDHNATKSVDLLTCGFEGLVKHNHETLFIEAMDPVLNPNFAKTGLLLRILVTG